MLTIDEKANYYYIVTAGKYKGHDFHILDTNKGLYVMFRNHYFGDKEEFIQIRDEIKQVYLSEREKKI